MIRMMELQCGAIGEARRSLEDARPSDVETTCRARDFIRRADWLRERFPDARPLDIEGLVKLVDRAEIEAHDWNLPAGREVGVAHEEEDVNFGFEEALRSIYIALKGLKEDAAALAARITRNFGELGA